MALMETCPWKVLLKRSKGSPMQLKQFLVMISRNSKSFESFVEQRRMEDLEDETEFPEDGQLESPHAAQHIIKMLCEKRSRPCERSMLSL
mmetsp:Transcript_1458/g.2554  ORF Transcript_1458/g.2554 Transcript_1458/m.2554 type:complete len:90 (-) Transcript_1458:71-340(-)